MTDRRAGERATSWSDAEVAARSTITTADVANAQRQWRTDADAAAKRLLDATPAASTPDDSPAP